MAFQHFFHTADQFQTTCCPILFKTCKIFSFFSHFSAKLWQIVLYSFIWTGIPALSKYNPKYPMDIKSDNNCEIAMIGKILYNGTSGSNAYRCKFSLFRVDPFLEGVSVQESKLQFTKVMSFQEL